MRNLFSIKLYIEGLKRLKIVGIAASIIVTILNALVPIGYTLVAMIESGDFKSLADYPKTIVNASNFAIPMFVIMFLTVFFAFSAFSFLNRRNESDFYHAIPYKRTCLFGSFAAATITWIWGIVVGSSLVTTVLWLICPVANFVWSGLFIVIAEYFVVTLYLVSFLFLAVSLTGTTVSGISVSLILLFCLRITFFMFQLCCSELVPFMDLSFSPLRFLMSNHWMPAAIFTSFFDLSVLQNASLWIYTIAIALIVLVLAGLAFNFRKSENASQGASSRIMQHVYQSLFSLPFAILIATIIICEGNPTAVVILLFIFLLVFYLYELITTKSAKCMLTSSICLPIILAVTLLFTGTAYIVRSVVLNGKYSKDEIQSVGVYEQSDFLDVFESLFSYMDETTYEELQAAACSTEDAKAKELVSNALSTTIDNFKKYNNIRGEYNPDINYMYQDVTINLKSGRTIGRKLYFTEEQYMEFQNTLMESPEYAEAALAIPKKEEIVYISANMLSYTGQSELETLYNVFADEYNALPKEKKVAYKMRNTVNYDENYLQITGKLNGKTFYSTYPITEDFPKAKEMMISLKKKELEGTLAYLTDFINGKYDDFFRESTEKYEYRSVNINIDVYPGGDKETAYLSIFSDDHYYGDTAAYLSTSKKIVQKVLDSLNRETIVSDYFYSNGEPSVSIYFWVDNNRTSTSRRATFLLNKTDAAALFDAIKEFYVSDDDDPHVQVMPYDVA